MDDAIESRISSLRQDDFEPTKVVLAPDSDEPDVGIDFAKNDVLSRLEKDFVVCHRDSLEESTLALPSPEKVRDEIVGNLELEEISEEQKERHDDYSVDDELYGLQLSVFVDLKAKGVEFVDENLEKLSFSKDDLPIDEEENEVDEGDEGMMESIEFAVVGSPGDHDSLEELEGFLRYKMVEEMCYTFYRGEYSYPLRYQESEDRDPIRIGREYIKFERIMMPENLED